MMKCKDLKKSLVFFLEGELPEEQRVETESHLKSCPDCARLLEEFSQLWEGVQQRERIQPPPFFWTKLKQRIIEYEEGKKPVFAWLGGLIRLPRPAVAVAATLVCIFLGYSLGDFPQKLNGQTLSRVEESLTAGEEFIVSSYYDPVTGLPSGSIEATYLKMISEE